MGVKTLASLCVAAAFALAVAAPAAAQTEDFAPASPALHVSVPSFVADSSASAETTPAFDMSFGDQQRAQPTTHTMGGRQVFLRFQGGLVFCCTDTGFVVGVGVSGQPRAFKNIEVAGDVSFGRFGGANYLYISVNGLYDFHLKAHEVMPYAGAGIGVAHTGAGDGNTSTDFQIMGGLQLPVKGPRVVRVEIRWLFTPDTTTFLLASFTF